MHIKKILAYNLAVLLVAIQVVVIINYWYFIYKKAAGAEINQTISYQGKLTGEGGFAIANGSYNMKFYIYNDLTSTSSANLLWTEAWDNTNQGVAQSQVLVTDGIFSVELNSLCGSWIGGCASNGGVDFNQGTVYLQVELDADGNGAYEEVFTPRKRFSTAAYANNVDAIDGASSGVSGDSIPTLSGNSIWSGIMNFVIPSNYKSGLIVVGSSSQSANLFELSDSNDSLVTSIDEQGYLDSSNVLNDKITSNSSIRRPSTSDSRIISYWPMDEGSGTGSADLTNTNNVLITGATWNSTGYFGYTGDKSLNFDGTSDYLAAIDSPTLDSLPKATFEFWMKPNYDYSPSSNAGFFSKGGYGSSALYGVYHSPNGAIYSNINDQSVYQLCLLSTVANTWYHMVFVWDGEYNRCYINGVEQGSYYSPFNLGENASSFYIGSYVYNYETNIESFNGSIDNFAIYNDALSAKEVASHYYSGLEQVTQLPNLNDPSIISYWQFDEPSGETLIDKKRNYDGYHLLSNRYTDGGPINYSGNGYFVLDDSGDYLNLGMVAELDSATQFTISGWAYQDILDYSEVLFYKYDHGDDYLGIETSGNGNMYVSVVNYNGITRGYFDYSTVITEDEWFSFDMVFDGSGATNEDRLKLYINGSPITLTYEGTIPSTTGPESFFYLAVGKFISDAQYEWSGGVDNFILYSRPLTATEIKRNYNSATQQDYAVALDIAFESATSNDLVQIANAGVEVASFATTGQLNATGLTSTGQILISPDADIIPFVIKSYSSQTQDLVNLKDNSSNIISKVVSSGNFEAPQLISNDVVTTLTTSSTVLMGIEPATTNSNLTAFWKMDEASGLSITDSVGLNTGTVTNPEPARTIGKIGYSGDYSLPLDGTNNSVSVGSLGTFGSGMDKNAFTFWYKSTNTSDVDAIIGAQGTPTLIIAKNIDENSGLAANKFMIQISDGGSNQLTAATTSAIANASDGQWHHVIFTSDIASGTVQMYFDGVLQPISYYSGNTLGFTMSDFTQVYLGFVNSYNWYFNGTLDNVAIYTDVLTSREAKLIYGSDVEGNAVGVTFDLNNEYTAETSTLYSIRTGGAEKSVIKNNLLSFIGADKYLKIDRANMGVGNDLLISPSSATLGGADLNGGMLYLNTGISTGSSASNIIFQSYSAGTSGTTDNTAVSTLTVSSDGSVRIAENKELRFYDGSFYVGFNAPTLSANQVWTLPSADGATSTTWKTDGAGVLSFGYLNGGKISAVTSSPYTILSTDQIVGVNYNGAATLTLPTPTSGKVILIKDEGGFGGITVNPSASETIDGASSAGVSAYGKLNLISDGSNWFSF